MRVLILHRGVAIDIQYPSRCAPMLGTNADICVSLVRARDAHMNNSLDKQAGVQGQDIAEKEENVAIAAGEAYIDHVLNQ